MIFEILMKFAGNNKFPKCKIIRKNCFTEGVNMVMNSLFWVIHGPFLFDQLHLLYYCVHSQCQSWTNNWRLQQAQVILNCSWVCRMDMICIFWWQRVDQGKTSLKKEWRGMNEVIGWYATTTLGHSWLCCRQLGCNTLLASCFLEGKGKSHSRLGWFGWHFYFRWVGI